VCPLTNTPAAVLATLYVAVNALDLVGNPTIAPSCSLYALQAGTLDAAVNPHRVSNPIHRQTQTTGC
jgi:hypothetical protein